MSRVEWSGAWNAPHLSLRAAADRNPNHQTPSSREVPNLKHETSRTDVEGKRHAGRFLSFELRASLDLGVWNLEIVAWPPNFSKIEMRPWQRLRKLPIARDRQAGKPALHYCAFPRLGLDDL